MICPPRAKHKILPARIDNFDTGEYLAQPKLNGSCSALAMTSKNYELWNRHGGKLASSIDFGNLYRGKGEMILVGEYMNKGKSDGKGIKFNNKLVIWDVVCYNGKNLIGTRFDERVDLLFDLYKPEPYDEYIMQISEDVFMVDSFGKKFGKLFKEIIKIDMYEGLVLKKRHGILERFDTDNTNKGWQVKVRKPTNSYTF